MYEVNSIWVLSFFEQVTLPFAGAQQSLVQAKLCCCAKAPPAPLAAPTSQTQRARRPARLVIRIVLRYHELSLKLIKSFGSAVEGLAMEGWEGDEPRWAARDVCRRKPREPMPSHSVQEAGT